MTPDRFRRCLDALRWSQRGLAEALGCAPTLAKRWARGEAPVPGPVAAWLEDLAAQHAARPAPTDWRTRPMSATAARAEAA